MATRELKRLKLTAMTNKLTVLQIIVNNSYDQRLPDTLKR